MKKRLLTRSDFRIRTSEVLNHVEVQKKTIVRFFGKIVFSYWSTEKGEIETMDEFGNVSEPIIFKSTSEAEDYIENKITYLENVVGIVLTITATLALPSSSN